MSTTPEYPVLTRDYVAAAKGRLVFFPETEEEARFIARQLQDYGYKYYKPEYEAQMALAVKGSIYLDNDRTIMVSESRVEGIACSVDGFEGLFLPDRYNAAAAKLSPADVMQGAHAFFPRTGPEARGVLAALFAAGATIDGETGSMLVMTARALYQGVIVQDGKIGFSPGALQLKDVRIGTPSDLGIGPGRFMSQEQTVMMSAFNEMAARMEQMSQRLQRIENEVLPKVLDKKPALPKNKP